MKTCEAKEHSSDMVNYYGRCLGVCSECSEHLEQTGRYTTFCPSCDVCSECGCPGVDGFAHYIGCAFIEAYEMGAMEDNDDDSTL